MKNFKLRTLVKYNNTPGADNSMACVTVEYDDPSMGRVSVTVPTMTQAKALRTYLKGH